MTDQFLQTLGLQTGLPATIDECPVRPTDLDNDFEASRDNLIRVMQITKNAIDSLAIIASQSQDPEAYASLGSLIRAFTTQQSQLLQLYKLKGGTKSPLDQKPETTIVDNRQQSIFVGTPSDLSRIIEQQTKK